MTRQVIDDVPAVRAAAEELATARQRDAALTAKRDAAQRVLSGATPNATASDNLKAQRLLLDIGAEMLDAAAAVDDAKRKYAAATEAANAAKLASIDADRARLVGELDAALARAAAVNARLLELDERAQAIGIGMGAMRFSWHELLLQVPGYESRLETWRRVCRENLATPAQKG